MVYYYILQYTFTSGRRPFSRQGFRSIFSRLSLNVIKYYEATFIHPAALQYGPLAYSPPPAPPVDQGTNKYHFNQLCQSWICRFRVRTSCLTRAFHYILLNFEKIYQVPNRKCSGVNKQQWFIGIGLQVRNNVFEF